MNRITRITRKSVKRVTALGLGLLVAGWLAAGPVLAGSSSANLGVSASIEANCTISASPISFGSYDPIVAHKSADLPGTGTVTVTCTKGSSVTIFLDDGANPDAGSTEAAPLRRLKDGGSNYLSYELYSDGVMSAVWGATAETDVADTGTGAPVSHTVYGKIPQDQNVPAGDILTQS